MTHFPLLVAFVAVRCQLLPLLLAVELRPVPVSCRHRALPDRHLVPLTSRHPSVRRRPLLRRRPPETLRVLALPSGPTHRVGRRTP